MRTTTRPLIAVAVAGLLGAPLLAAVPAFAADTTNLQANLTSLNSSGATATVTGTLTGDQLKLTMNSKGFLADAPHAQHIHVGGTNSCPDPNQKGSGANGALQVKDAAPSYGAIAVSLTTSGDTGADSALAVDRFPVGDAQYTNTITVPDEVAQQIRDGKGVIVKHGVDLNKSGKYDGDVKSELDPALPEEATDPAACGKLVVSQMSTMPSGGVATGGGSTAGPDTALIAGGATAVAAGLGVGAVALRRRSVRGDAA